MLFVKTTVNNGVYKTYQIIFIQYGLNPKISGLAFSRGSPSQTVDIREALRGKDIVPQRHFVLYSNTLYSVIESMYISILYNSTGIE